MKLFTVTLAYATPQALYAGIMRYYHTRTYARPNSHILIDQNYPLRRKENLMAINQLCEHYNIRYVNPGKNLGYHHGFNFALKYLDKEMSDDDAILCYDPDSWPVEWGWDLALRAAMEKHTNVATAGILNPRSRKEIIERGYTELSPGVWKTHKPIVASLQAWRKGFIKEAGGFQEPCPYYGGIEAEMWPHLERQKKDWVMLSDFHEAEDIRDLKDKEYRDWQWAHAHLRSFQGDFAEFLAAGCPLPSPAPEQIP